MGCDYEGLHGEEYGGSGGGFSRRGDSEGDKYGALVLSPSNIKSKN